MSVESSCYPHLYPHAHVRPRSRLPREAEATAEGALFAGAANPTEHAINSAVKEAARLHVTAVSRALETAAAKSKRSSSLPTIFTTSIPLSATGKHDAQPRAGGSVQGGAMGILTLSGGSQAPVYSQIGMIEKTDASNNLTKVKGINGKTELIDQDVLFEKYYNYGEKHIKSLYQQFEDVMAPYQGGARGERRPKDNKGSDYEFILLNDKLKNDLIHQNKKKEREYANALEKMATVGGGVNVKLSGSEKEIEWVVLNKDHILSYGSLDTKSPAKKSTKRPLKMSSTGVAKKTAKRSSAMSPPDTNHGAMSAAADAHATSPSIRHAYSNIQLYNVHASSSAKVPPKGHPESLCMVAEADPSLPGQYGKERSQGEYVNFPASQYYCQSAGEYYDAHALKQMGAYPEMYHHHSTINFISPMASSNSKSSSNGHPSPNSHMHVNRAMLNGYHVNPYTAYGQYCAYPPPPPPPMSFSSAHQPLWTEDEHGGASAGVYLCQEPQIMSAKAVEVRDLLGSGLEQDNAAVHALPQPHQEGYMSMAVGEDGHHGGVSADATTTHATARAAYPTVSPDSVFSGLLNSQQVCLYDEGSYPMLLGMSKHHEPKMAFSTYMAAPCVSDSFLPPNHASPPEDRKAAAHNVSARASQMAMANDDLDPFHFQFDDGFSPFGSDTFDCFKSLTGGPLDVFLSANDDARF